MSDLIRWEPMREMMTLREAMDHLFDDAFTRPISGRSGLSSLPAIDLYQDNDDVVVKASLPGLKKDDVQITLNNGVLTLRGEYKQEETSENTTYHIREHRSGSFERSISLPVEIDTEKTKAEFENGVLTITMPKVEAVKPRMIDIKVK
ncbi:MAG TPA: Hsp20/alpha crystallin family protein [Anaerolineales bacterium]|nr:Hsp20/alpha crystallin family protein [Anaerolineales bacterium]